MALYHSDIADIELESGNIHRSFLNHSIGSADNAANRFGVRVWRNGNPEDLSGVSCQGFFRNSRGQNIALTNHGNVSGNVAFVTLPQACYNYEGNFTLSIKLIGGGVTGTMRIIDGVVDNTNTGGAVAPTGTVPSYQEILAVYDEMQEMMAEYNNGENNNAAQIEQIKGILSLQDPDYKLFWQAGSIANDGTEIDSSTRIRTGYICLRDLQNVRLQCDSGYSFSYALYDTQKNASEVSAWTTEDQTITFAPGAYYLRVVLRNTSDAPIGTSEGYHLRVIPKSIIKETIDNITSRVTQTENDVTALQSSLSNTAAAIRGELAGVDADAAVQIEQVKGNLTLQDPEYALAWEQGSISNDGAELATDKRIRTGFIYLRDLESLTLRCESNYSYSYVGYTDRKVVSSFSSWKTAESVLTFGPGMAYIRLILQKGDAVIGAGEGEHMHAVPTSIIKKAYEDINAELREHSAAITELQTEQDSMATDIEALQLSNTRNTDNSDANAATLEKIQRELVLQDNIETKLAWVQGGLSNTGDETTANNRIRTPFFYLADMVSIDVSCASGYQVSILMFDDSKGNPSAGSWVTSENVPYAPGAVYVRFTLRKTGDGSILPADGTNLTVRLHPKLAGRLSGIESKINRLLSVVGSTLVVSST